MGFSSDDAVGYLACLVAVVFFGSNYVPVKRAPTADGAFFSLIMTSAIILEGLAVQLWRGNPKFEPFAMLGGVIWRGPRGRTGEAERVLTLVCTCTGTISTCRWWSRETS